MLAKIFKLKNKQIIERLRAYTRKFKESIWLLGAPGMQTQRIT